MLKVMLGKNLVERPNGERGYVWAARATRTAIDLVRKDLDHVFDGSAGRLVAHVLEETELDPRDRDENRKLLTPATPLQPRGPVQIPRQPRGAVPSSFATAPEIGRASCRERVWR